MGDTGRLKDFPRAGIIYLGKRRGDRMISLQDIREAEGG